MAEYEVADPNKYTVVAVRGAMRLVNRYREKLTADRKAEAQRNEGYTVEVVPPFERQLTAGIPGGMTATGRIDTRTREWEE